MLPSLNGNKILDRSYPFEVTDASQVGEVRRFAANMGSELDLDEVQQGKIAIVINELGNNLVKYAKNGEILLRAINENPAGRGIEILSIDRGPGMMDVTNNLRDGVTSSSSPGTGLGAVKRISDTFDIYSEQGKGTLIVSIVMSNKVNALTTRWPFNIGAICIPMKGEVVSGDNWEVRRTPFGFDLVAADGLGHGPLANLASTKTCATFMETTGSHENLLKSIHISLKGTRGAAVFVVTSANGGNVEYSGVGNIRCILQNKDLIKTLISQNGTAGLQMRTIKPLFQVWDNHTLLILHSDGVMGRWDTSFCPALTFKHPALMAAAIYRDYNRGTDDLLIVTIGKMHDSN
ncbi:MAG: ATP-binding SpoIIE family protein phosphatase [Bdellovibrionota bacterium]